MNVTNPPVAGQSLDAFLGVETEPMWKRRLRPILIGLGLLLLLLLAWWLLKPSEKIQYVTAPITRGELTVTVSATGNIRPINQVDVGSEQSGLITNVYVDVNDSVKKGQLLATLDTARLQDAVTQARASLAAAEANVVQAQATLAQSNASLARYQEVSRLSDGRVPSKTEMDSANADQQRAAATLKSAQAQVQQQQAAVGSATTNMSKARIYSPVTGVVLARSIEPGQTVAASLNAPVLFTIAEDLSQMELQVSIDEADVGEVKDGQDASFTVDAFPGRKFDAKIRRVNLGSNDSGSSTSSSSSAGQVVAYTALLSVDNSQQLLRPGMTATADIVTTRQTGTLLIPNAAFRFRPDNAGPAAGGGAGGITGAILPRGPRRNQRQRTATTDRGAQQSLYILDADGGPQQVMVTTGSTNGSVTQLLSGELSEGQQVVTGQLAPGAKAPKGPVGPGGAAKAGGRSGAGSKGG